MDGKWETLITENGLLETSAPSFDVEEQFDLLRNARRDMDSAYEKLYSMVGPDGYYMGLLQGIASERTRLAKKQAELTRAEERHQQLWSKAERDELELRQKGSEKQTVYDNLWNDTLVKFSEIKKKIELTLLENITTTEKQRKLESIFNESKLSGFAKLFSKSRIDQMEEKFMQAIDDLYRAAYPFKYFVIDHVNQELFASLFGKQENEIPPAKIKVVYKYSFVFIEDAEIKFFSYNDESENFRYYSSNGWALKREGEDRYTLISPNGESIDSNLSYENGRKLLEKSAREYQKKLLEDYKIKVERPVAIKAALAVVDELSKLVEQRLKELMEK